MKFIYKLITAALFVFVSCNSKSKINKQEEAAVSTQKTAEFSKLKLAELDGTPIDLTKYKGKSIFINFWATWCKPCVEELPSIQKAMKSVTDEHMIFLFASNEERDDIERFKKNNPYNFHYVKVLNIEQLTITALPTTYIFNRQRELVFSEMGYRKWDEKTNLHIITSNCK